MHPKFVVKETLKVDSHKIIGSGRVVFVRDFIEKLFDKYHMKLKDYVAENKENDYNKHNNMFYLDSRECLYAHDELYDDTIKDLDLIVWSKYGKI